MQEDDASNLQRMLKSESLRSLIGRQEDVLAGTNASVSLGNEERTALETSAKRPLRPAGSSAVPPSFRRPVVFDANTDALFSANEFASRLLTSRSLEVRPEADHGRASSRHQASLQFGRVSELQFPRYPGKEDVPCYRPPKQNERGSPVRSWDRQECSSVPVHVPRGSLEGYSELRNARAHVSERVAPLEEERVALLRQLEDFRSTVQAVCAQGPVGGFVAEIVCSSDERVSSPARRIHQHRYQRPPAFWYVDGCRINCPHKKQAKAAALFPLLKPTCAMTCGIPEVTTCGISDLTSRA